MEMNYWKLLETAQACNAERILLYGPPSVGKSHTAREMYPSAVECTLFEDISAQELLGHYIPAGNVFVWNDGPITDAMRNGRPLIINELPRASGSVLDAMLAVLDKPAMLTLPNREKIVAAPGFIVICTSNAGPEVLDPALQSRFDAIVTVTRPSPSVVEKLNQLRNYLGSAVHDSYAGDKSPITPRQAFAWCKFVEAGATEEESCALVFGKAHPDFLLALKARGKGGK